MNNWGWSVFCPKTIKLLISLFGLYSFEIVAKTFMFVCKNNGIQNNHMLFDFKNYILMAVKLNNKWKSNWQYSGGCLSNNKGT